MAVEAARARFLIEESRELVLGEPATRRHVPERVRRRCARRDEPPLVVEHHNRVLGVLDEHPGALVHAHVHHPFTTHPPVTNPVGPLLAR